MGDAVLFIRLDEFIGIEAEDKDITPVLIENRFITANSEVKSIL